MAKQGAAQKALEQHDLEVMSRKVKTECIEGDIPYNREVYTNHMKFLLKQTAESLLIVGKMLLVMKEKEPHGTFMQIVEDEVGLSHTSALRFMNAALKAEKYPTIEFAKFTKLANLYTLLEAPEEDLKELEEKGVLAGNSIDELQRMSVKEMRELIRKLRTEVDKVVKEEVKGLQAEKRALIKENERLKAFDPTDKDEEWSIEQMEAVEKAAHDFDMVLRKFAMDERVKDNPEVQAKVEAVQTRIEKRFELFRENWDAVMNAD